MKPSQLNWLIVNLIVYLLLTGNFAFAKPVSLWKSALPICSAYGKIDQQNPRITADNSGGYYIIFEDNRSGATKLYGQRINEGGKLLWGKNGIEICGSKSSQGEAKLIVSGSSGIIVAWQDDRNHDFDIYAQKLSPAGEKLWNPSGVPIIQAPKNQVFPDMTKDNNGGAFICWQDLRNNIEDIYIQRINSSGQILWQQQGIAITSKMATQRFPKITNDGMGGVTVIWSDRRDGNFDLYAQRLGKAGEIFWEPDGKLIAQSSYAEENPVIASFNNGTIAVAYLSKGSGVYAQMFNSKGNLYFDKTGKKVSTQQLDPSAPALALGKNNSLIILWSDSYAGDSDIYAQKIDSSGNFLWSSGDHPVVRIRGIQHDAKILGSDPYIAAWIDERSGRPEIYAQKINDQGTMIWRQNGKRISKDQAYPRNYDFVINRKNEVVVCFDDKRSGSYDIYAQKIKSAGEVAWSYSGKLINSSYGRSSQRNVSFVNDSSNNHIFAFEDMRSGYPNIYLQKINSQGKKLWKQGGIRISQSSDKQLSPRLINDGKGGVIVVWEDYRNPQGPKVFSQRISSAGKKLWHKTGVPLTKSPAHAEQIKPQIAADGKGGAIVVWEDFQGHFNAKDILGQRINSKGKRLWGDRGITVVTGGSDQANPIIAPSGFIVIWQDSRMNGQHTDIYAQKISPSGKLLWQEDGIAVCEAPDVQLDPAIINVGKDAFISWTDKGGGSYDIFAQKINQLGKPKWVKDGIPVCQSSRTQQRVRLTLDNQKNIILTWEDFRYGNWNIYFQGVDQAGKLLWSKEGLPIINEQGTQYDPQIIKVGSKNIIAWEDQRSGDRYVIYLQKIDGTGERFYSPEGAMVNASGSGGRSPRLLASRNQKSFIAVWEDFRFGAPTIYAQRFRP